MSTVDDAFERVAAQLLANDEHLERGRMFGSTALKTAGEVFAMAVKGELVVKLPATRVAELLADRAGRPFDPGHGRLLKEWVALRPSDQSDCNSYVREALAFVRTPTGR